MTESLVRQPANKLLGLELLRFVTAFAVVVWHYQHFAFVADTASGLTRDRLPLYGLLQPFYHAGLYGVWVFWCISGFIFFWKYREPIDNRSVGAWHFFVFRLSRLYPLHVATLLLVAVLQSIYFLLNDYFFVFQDNDLRHFLLQTVMASNWGFQHGNSFDGPVWSISVEVLVYAIFFLILRFVTRSALVHLVIIAACADARLFHVSNDVLDCLAFFYAGGLVAIARRAWRYRPAIERGAWFLLGILPVLSGILELFRYELFPYGFMLTWGQILLFSLSREFSVGPLIHRLIVVTGNMTYSSYLLHFPIQLVIALSFSLLKMPIPIYDTRLFAVFVASTLLAAYLTYRWVEAPAQNIVRQRLLRGHGVAVPAAASVSAAAQL
jgi:peptidoglycan/LPS O-acetylase OafA/YrhL